MDDRDFKRRGIHTIADVQMHDDAVRRRQGLPAKRVVQVADHARGAASPLLGLANGDGDYKKTFWR